MLLSLPTTSSDSNGYNQTNCQQHVDQHQRLLDEQLDWLTVDHDDLRQDLLEQISRPKYHPSMAVIDQWEEESIARIRHAAVLARRALIDALDQHAFEVQKTLNMLTPKLREARNRIKSFNENDIQKWAAMLQELKKMPVFPITVDKDKNIHGLTIDLRKEKRTDHFKSNRKESITNCLFSIVRDPTASTSTSNRTICQIVPTNLTNKTDADNKNLKLDDVSSNRSQTVTPGGVIIIREQQKEKSTTSAIPVRRAHAEIPFDSRTYYPLRGPATVYQ